MSLLDFNLAAHAKARGGRLTVIGNLPFGISSQGLLLVCPKEAPSSDGSRKKCTPPASCLCRLRRRGLNRYMLATKITVTAFEHERSLDLTAHDLEFCSEYTRKHQLGASLN
jgi:hypothetical protein